MDRAEQTGIGIAVIGHVVLFGALSLSLLSPPILPKLDSQPVEVTLASEVDLQSSAPAPTPQAVPAPAPPTLAPMVEPTPAPPPVAKPIPEPVAAPKPSPKAIVKPTPKPAQKPVKVAVIDPTARRRPGLSNSIVSGLADTPTPAKAAKPGRIAPPSPVAATGISVAQMTGAQKASLNSLIYSQLKPHWKPPSGADAELLITRLSVRLNQDGSLASDPEVIDQQGINDSNRTQAKLHAERAIQAVRRAAPFKLPPDYYEAWKWLRPLKLYVGQPG